MLFVFRESSAFRRSYVCTIEVMLPRMIAKMIAPATTRTEARTFSGIGPGPIHGVLTSVVSDQ